MRLVLGADEADGAAYDVTIGWTDGHADAAAETLSSLELDVSPANYLVGLT